MSSEKFEYPDKFASEVGQVPKEPHWAIIKFDSIFIPGDERSRTNPGHGYAERTESSLSYEVYLTEEKWKRQITYRAQKNDLNYVALKVQPATVTVVANVEVNLS